VATHVGMYVFELFQGLTAKTECCYDNFITSMTPLLLNVCISPSTKKNNHINHILLNKYIPE